MSDMKVGDRLYTVYEDDWGTKAKLLIKSVKITAAGPQRLSIAGPDGGRAGLAFRCRSQISRAQAADYGRTEREAWQQYVDRVTLEIEEGERALVALRTNLHRALQEITP